jgi:hypothetical protein
VCGFLTQAHLLISLELRQIKPVGSHTVARNKPGMTVDVFHPEIRSTWRINSGGQPALRNSKEAPALQLKISTECQCFRAGYKALKKGMKPLGAPNWGWRYHIHFTLEFNTRDMSRSVFPGTITQGKSEGMKISKSDS